jgi:ribosome-associated protein
MYDDDYEDEPEFVSKSALKREMSHRQAVGESLVKLPAEQLQQMTIPGDLREAIMAAQKMPQRGAHKRQLQYIGRLMRSVELEPIEQQLNDLKGDSAKAVKIQHEAETWRERLLSEGNTALTELMSRYHSAESQRLRQLIRSAQNEAKSNKPPRSARELFRYLRELISHQ